MLPLTGPKVVELREYVAGVFAAKALGRRSAHVVKIERPEGDDALADFSGEADIPIQSLRPGSLGTLGLEPDALIARRPRLIYCSGRAVGRCLGMIPPKIGQHNGEPLGRRDRS
jgi:crotonobetainyl-CoA:carnitine CoA-transferase CaiB-like acyl-CoA transferase